MLGRLLLHQEHPECPVGFTMPETQPSLPEGFTRGRPEKIYKKENTDVTSQAGVNIF